MRCHSHFIKKFPPLCHNAPSQSFSTRLYAQEHSYGSDSARRPDSAEDVQALKQELSEGDLCDSSLLSQSNMTAACGVAMNVSNVGNILPCSISPHVRTPRRETERGWLCMSSTQEGG
jgi:hypothetical protein